MAGRLWTSPEDPDRAIAITRRTKNARAGPGKATGVVLGGDEGDLTRHHGNSVAVSWDLRAERCNFVVLSFFHDEVSARVAERQLLRVARSLSPPGDRPPEGRLLVQLGSRVEVIDAVTGRTVVARGVQGHDFSPGGTSVVGTVEEPLPELGVSVHTELVVTEVARDWRETVFRAGPRATIGDPSPSPDGTRVAFTLAAWEAGRHRFGEERLCTVELRSKETRCFEGLGALYSFDWSPAGDELLVGGPGDQPVYVVDAATEESRVLLPPGGTESVREGLASLDGYGDRAAQFALPQWSPDGRFVAAAGSVAPGGWVPVVVDREGALVALGEPNPHGSQAIAWSPAENVLAHTTGHDGIGPPGVTFGVHVLDVATGDTRLLHSTNGSARPAIAGLEWSPSGRWIALDLATAIPIVAVRQRADPYVVDLHH
ncbi:MAG: hypothetical protein M3271_07870, partial [Actinomycetota bacterium]|nr:hypothetical protein [Actinomycetota bacterium]